jgi:hypothetical protein
VEGAVEKLAPELAPDELFKARGMDLKSNIQVSVLAAGHYVVSKPYLIQARLCF